MSDERGEGISSRKEEHIALCETDAVAFRRKSNLLDQVELVHDALPELAWEDVDLATTFADRPLRAPLLIAAMTGGTRRAEAINRDLAAVAEAHGIGFGFGSQRPLLEHGIATGYRVRDVAPTTLVLANIGVVQAARHPTAELERMVERCGADALVVHLNPAMELVQPGGDRDFRHGLATLARLVRELPVPLVVKETGCGLSRRVGERLRDIGVRWVDTSGAGGTSWVGVETLRAGRAEDTGRAGLGEAFWDWGIPTAASVVQLADLGLGTCATGGIVDGLGAARAIALGATCVGIARPFLQAWSLGGAEAVDEAVRRILDALRVAHLLTGSATPAALARQPVRIGPQLAAWVPAGSSVHRRMQA